MGERPLRIIKRYPNRKLYDTHQSAYITMKALAELFRNDDEDIHVHDYKSGEDLTPHYFQRVQEDIYEEADPSAALGRMGTFLQRVADPLSHLREGAGGALRDWTDYVQRSLETMQGALEERWKVFQRTLRIQEGLRKRLKALEDRLSAREEERREHLRAIEERLDALERELQRLREGRGEEDGSP